MQSRTSRCYLSREPDHSPLPTCAKQLCTFCPKNNKLRQRGAKANSLTSKETKKNLDPLHAFQIFLRVVAKLLRPVQPTQDQESRD